MSGRILEGQSPDHGHATRTSPILRVVGLVPGIDFSGPAGQVASTAVELTDRGVEVRFVLLRRRAAGTGSLPKFLDRHGIRYVLLEDRGALDFRLAVSVRRILAEWQPHILETHGYKATAIAFLLKHLSPSWRWVGFFHGVTRESRRACFYHQLDHMILGRADCAIAVSEEQRRRLLRWAPGTRVIKSAVTILDDVSSGAEVVDLSARLASSAHPRLAVIGRLSPEKGVDVFLRSMALLTSRGVAFSAVVVGDGAERRALQDLAAALGVGGRIQFLGHVSQMRQLYEQIDLLVIPSRSEGLPSVLLEALNADLPVVSTRVGAIPEVLRRPGSGVLVAPDSPASLADGIEAGLTSLGSEDARRARAAAAGTFSQERRATALLTIYRELLGAADGPHDPESPRMVES